MKPAGGPGDRLVIDGERLRDPAVAQAELPEPPDFRCGSLVSGNFTLYWREGELDLCQGSNALRPCPPFWGVTARRQEIGGGPALWSPREIMTA